mgnify:FL=1
MKKTLLPFLLFTLFATSNLQSQSFLVDNEKSTVFWLGKKVTGEHYGYINISKGKMSIKDNQIVSGNFVIDMNSMTCTDIENASMNKKLLEHLTSDDFFGTKSYPNATLEVESSTKFKDNKSTVTGMLSIKGKSERITFEVTKSGNTYTANLEIDRSKFNVRYGSTSFFDSLGNRAIDDIFTLKINLVVDTI